VKERSRGVKGERMARLLRRLLSRRRWAAYGADAGMTTAEYAVGTLAAVAFAGVLLKVLTSPSVQSALSSIVTRALK
jgi:hypothetical protein